MLEIIQSILEDQSITFEYEESSSDNPHAFYFDEKFEHGFMRGVIGVHYQEKMVHIYRMFPTSLPGGRVKELSEYITRINSDKKLGTFELDFEDMHFGISATFPLSKDENEQKETLHTYFNALTYGLNKYFEGALKIGFGEHEPATVLNQLDFNVDPRLN
ncbi:MAG: hypothetical protein WD053_05480 [Gracilimonas sp.]